MPAKRSNIHDRATQTNLRREIFGGVDTDSVIMVEMFGVGNAGAAEDVDIDATVGNMGVEDRGIRTETFRKSASLNALGDGKFGRSGKSDELDGNGHCGGRSIESLHGVSGTVSSSSKIRKEREGIVAMFCGLHFEFCGPIAASLEHVMSDESHEIEVE